MSNSNENEMDVEEAQDRAESDDDLEEDEDSSEDEAGEDKTFLPGDKIEEGEQLEVDENAYVVYHQASLGPPCLSFDLLPDKSTQDFPLSVTAVAGTQAAKVTANSIIMFRMSNLHSVRPVGEDEDEENVEEPEEEKPVLKMAGLKHSGTVNRIRYCLLGPTPVVATWSETGSVSIWNMSGLLQRLELPGKDGGREEASPLQSFTGHSAEGYALDWSRANPGVLASGDCNQSIHVWRPGEGGSWTVSDVFRSHTSSVEDIKWSPNETTVMASCSCDKSIKIWDIRAAPSSACMLTQSDAHTADVNVIDWNKNDPFIVSGGDDGVVKVWDLRNFSGQSDPVAVFKHHTAPVTSVEWHHEDSSVFASSGADDQVAQWDLALERDAEVEQEDPQLKQLPPQLLFIHQGLKDVKEIHWHQRIPGLMMATSHTGFDVFRTISV